MGVGKDTYGRAFKKLFPSALHLSFAQELKTEVKSFIVQYIIYKNNKHYLQVFFNIDTNYIDKIYTIAKNIDTNNIDLTFETKTKETRELLQTWGEMRRKQSTNYWVNTLLNNINKANSSQNIYITDLRFINEIEAIKAINGIVVLLTASEKERKRRIQNRDNIIPTKEALNHISETGLDKYKGFDFIIDTEKEGLYRIETVLNGILSEVKKDCK